ncbi:MAG: hypothetical protein RLZZ28_2624 [Bacteroidota bacterium]
MSHLPERKEKNCLNCGAEVQGRFCHICGQENIPPKESFWHLVTHFAYDITHFDGKFFSTLKYLLFKPGYLSHEYLKGKRASYLHPIRMYVFTSAIFFLIFFNLNKQEEVVKIDDKSPSAAETLKKLEKGRAGLMKQLEKDSLPEFAKTPLKMGIAAYDSDIALLKKDSTAKYQLKTQNNFNVFNFSTKDTAYASIKTYDSIQNTLPQKGKDNFIQRKFAHQNLHLKEKYKNNSKAIWEAIFEKFKHLFPQMLFVSLPLFALLLKLLYIRRKNFYYVNHLVYSIHLYCATFIIILIDLLTNSLLKSLTNKESGWIAAIILFFGIYYWYKSLRNFYEQSRLKTLLKYLLVFFMSIFIFVFIFIIFFLFSAMSI